jgi:hypothetical protein
VAEGWPEDGRVDRDPPPRLAEAARQIRAGSRMLVREVKALQPADGPLPPAEGGEGAELARCLQKGDLPAMEACVDRLLAPLLAGPGAPGRHRGEHHWRRRLLLLAAILGLAALVCMA